MEDVISPGPITWGIAPVDPVADEFAQKIEVVLKPEPIEELVETYFQPAEPASDVIDVESGRALAAGRRFFRLNRSVVHPSSSTRRPSTAGEVIDLSSDADDELVR